MKKNHDHDPIHFLPLFSICFAKCTVFHRYWKPPILGQVALFLIYAGLFIWFIFVFRFDFFYFLSHLVSFSLSLSLSLSLAV